MKRSMALSAVRLLTASAQACATHCEPEAGKAKAEQTCKACHGR